MEVGLEISNQWQDKVTSSLSTKVSLIIGLLISESVLSATPLSQADAAWLIRYLNNWFHICSEWNNIVKSSLFL